ncbi:Mbov_0398 family ICE element protein [Mycoplasma sp. 4423]
MKEKDFVQITTRVTGAENVEKLWAWKAALKRKKQTPYEVLRNIVLKVIDNTYEEEIIEKGKDRLFYALRKALFASMTPYFNHIDNTFNLLLMTNEIIDKKLNLLLNMQNEKVNLYNLKESDVEDLNYFAQLKKYNYERAKNIESKSKKINEKIEKTFERYLRTEMNGGNPYDEEEVENEEGFEED